MDDNRLIGKRVMNVKTRHIGTIRYIRDSYVAIEFYGEIEKYAYPSAFAGELELENEDFQKEIYAESRKSMFENFKIIYCGAVIREIKHLKATGGKKYRLVDGELLSLSDRNYVYAFDTDSDLHFPVDTIIKLWLPDRIIPGSIISCEDFTVTLRIGENIGVKVPAVDITSEEWFLLENLVERVANMTPKKDSIAYEVACNGKKQISLYGNIRRGQNLAFSQATTEKITFIWGPPGTGKTETLANIALEHIKNGKRVLMLSYSNVSVDGALLRVVRKADLPIGTIIRYGYPRAKELLESKTLTSYAYVLYQNPELVQREQALREERKKTKKKDLRRAEIDRELNIIRNSIKDKQQMVIQEASFVATTVSKAISDNAIYNQKFEVVIFDEASMAYVPQIIFSAGLASQHFVCLGDFQQLPAIVQDNDNDVLKKDIFEYTGITSAVNNNKGHAWLVMLDLQFRMHKTIADFVSLHMYNGMLNTSERIAESRDEMASCIPYPGAAMTTIDVSGMYSVCTRTMDQSRINVLSAFVCLRLAERLIRHYEIGIITPYSAQSRLIMAMVRDIREYDQKWNNVACATVHQFQGSEKPIIIYDAVDCFRMPFPGALLTSMKNDTANRLFNVALTRAKGKFILVANLDYLKRKKISKKLIFTKAIQLIDKEEVVTKDGFVLDEMMPEEGEEPVVFIEDRNASWAYYLNDILSANSKILIDIPDVIEEDEEAIEELLQALREKGENKVTIRIRVSDEVELPVDLGEYIFRQQFLSSPVTIIDDSIVWFGQPLCSADFFSEGEIIDTEYFACVRFKGKYTASSLKSFLEM